jgi:ubiquinone/menaquinone biosynthesis C-methylase UbiE
MRFYQDRVVPYLINLAMRNRQFAPYRERTMALAEGRVLEIGVGSGLNLPFYTDRAIEILGLDPHPGLLRMAAERSGPIQSKLIEGTAESIPLDDASIDTVVTTWTLCSIPNVTTALAEMRRILKPHGKLLFVEHGLAPDDGVRKWQNRLTPIWKQITGGCHLNRPIARLVEDVGFHISLIETGYMRGPRPMTFMYEGTARPI